MNTCPNCGGSLFGDGYTTPRRCEFSEEDFSVEPDAGPIFCKPDTTMNEQIKIGSRWERIVSRHVWTVDNINPNGTVTISLKDGDHREIETYQPDFFVGAFRELPTENPLVKVHHES